MTNIERQQATVARMVAVLAKGYRRTTNMQMNRIRCAHVDAMRAAGYGIAEAIASAQECSDVAHLQADAS